MAVLICGGAGYIGSHAVRALREQGREVVVLDSLRTGHRQSLPADVPFVEGDMRDPAVLDAIFVRHTVESVLHFAASSLGGVGFAEGVTMGHQLLVQLESIAITIVWSGVVAFIGYKLADLTVGLRVPEEQEREGLDVNSHGENAYNA